MITLKIRQTHARVFKQCERKYELMVVHRLQPNEKSVSLSIGTAAHAGRANWLKNWDLGLAVTAAIASIEAEVINHPMLDKPHDAKDCTYRPCVACAKRITLELITEYCTHFHDSYRFPKDSLQILAIELPFEYVLAQYEDLELILQGTLDAAALYGPYFVNFEFKTTKKQLGQYFEQEAISPQHTAYCMALAKLFPEYGIAGTIVDVSRKPGKTYPPESKHEFFPIGEEDIAELRRDYTEQLKRIRRAMDSDYYPPNFDNCFTIRGRCEYYPICKSKFNPAIIRGMYHVVDDLKVLLGDKEDEDNTGSTA